MNALSLSLIQDAANFLRPHIRKTPLEWSPKLSEILGAPVYLKLEFLQHTGSFKLRGAFFRLSLLTPEERLKGVVTCSAGNHGKAVAYVAKKLGVKATIFVPRDVDQVKYQGMAAYGAEIIRTPYLGYDQSEEMAKQFAQDEGRLFVTPYDEEPIMAANGGTIAMEMLHEMPELGTFVLPVGGGGLAAGFSFYVKEQNPKAMIIGCQHEGSPSLKMSFEKGVAVTSLPAIETLAAGVEGGIGARCFNYMLSRIDQTPLVSEQELIEALLWMLREHQYLIEPSSAVALAACLQGRFSKPRTPTAIVLTGRNVSYKTLKKLIEIN